MEYIKYKYKYKICTSHIPSQFCCKMIITASLATKWISIIEYKLVASEKHEKDTLLCSWDTSVMCCDKSFSNPKWKTNQGRSQNQSNIYWITQTGAGAEAVWGAGGGARARAGAGECELAAGETTINVTKQTDDGEKKETQKQQIARGTECERERERGVREGQRARGREGKGERGRQWNHSIAQQDMKFALES